MARLIKLITFDVTGTLMILQPPVAVKYAESAKRFDISVHPEDILRNFKIQWKELSKSHQNFGKESGIGWEKWWTEIVVRTFKAAAPLDDEKKMVELAAYLIEEYKTSRCWALADGALDLLCYLRKSGSPIGVISNYDERLEEVLRSVKIHSYFNFIVNSYSAGVMKPNRRIFDFARSQVPGNIAPAHCLHIGNSIDFDYKGATNAGWNSIFVGEPTSDVLETAARSDVFKSLKELKRYFERYPPVQP